MQPVTETERATTEPGGDSNAPEGPRVCVIAPAGDDRARLVESLSMPEAPRVFDDVGSFLADVGDPEEGGGGAVLLSPDVGAEGIVELLKALADGMHGWVPLLLEQSEDGATALPLDAGFRLPAAEAVGRVLSPDPQEPVLELRTVLRWVAKARHDINNPLTAAMAEAQLLLMDDHGDEVRESVEVIQAQLRRIRDLVAMLRAVKP